MTSFPATSFPVKSPPPSVTSSPHSRTTLEALWIRIGVLYLLYKVEVLQFETIEYFLIKRLSIDSVCVHIGEII